MKRVFPAVLAFAFALTTSVGANAQLSINRLWVDLDAGQAARSDLVIRNDSKDRYYITVETAEILAPGTEAEERREIADPEQLGLLVTPNRMVLEPGASRAIRVVSLNQNLAQDRIYRVLIRPQVGDIQATATQGEVRDIAIKILSAYEALVVARPPNATPIVGVERLADRMVFSNTGNSNLLFLDAFICPSSVSGLSANDSCRPFPATRLYAGGKIEVPITSTDEVFIVRERRSADAEPVTVRY